MCAEAIRRKWPTVCVSPRHVALAKRFIGHEAVRVCTVIGFPHGTSTQGALRFEVADAVASGAVEIDMVGPVGALVEGDLATWYEAVRAVVDTARQFAAPPVVKVILETSALPIDAVIKGAMVAVAAGVDFVKTSTGFHAGGALVADVAAMTMAVGGRAGVKASAAFAPPKRRSCCCASGQIGSARPQRGNCCRNFSPQATAFRRAPQTGA
ncbi:deoxyribose-phosphate aldolase [Alicyclobacillus sacchari]|uniref:deoxyribose-phosphate aldolase n=1 Tax=Alicyclobacillus sacchari TaxID=392010 RepID=UPI0024E1652D|nr:deoxyribose-phosphate aldolase [Alicyclobacillus sacchari]